MYCSQFVLGHEITPIIRQLWRTSVKIAYLHSNYKPLPVFMYLCDPRHSLKPSSHYIIQVWTQTARRDTSQLSCPHIQPSYHSTDKTHLTTTTMINPDILQTKGDEDKYTHSIHMPSKGQAHIVLRDLSWPINVAGYIWCKKTVSDGFHTKQSFNSRSLYKSA